MNHSFISGESLRTRMTRFHTPTGWSELQPYTNLLGAPIGDTVEVWKWDRLVQSSGNSTRRVDEASQFHRAIGDEPPLYRQNTPQAQGNAPPIGAGSGQRTGSAFGKRI